MVLTLFGPPQTGKTTLFRLLTGAKPGPSGHDASAREPHGRTIALPDPRLDRLAAVHPDKSRIPAQAEIVDLVGISFGEVRNSLLLGHLRKADGLVHVIRAFRSEALPPPERGLDPARDARQMEEELVLADLVLLEGRLERLEKDLRKARDPEGERERDLLLRLRPLLESGRGLRHISLPPSEEKLVRSFALLSLKPLVHAINLDDADAGSVRRPEALYPSLGDGRRVFAFCGRLEPEIEELEGDERSSFMAAYGLEELSAPRLAGAVLGLLDRIAFFTIGKQEVRAWPLKNGATAIEAAGAIHTDMAKGFIRAEVIACEDLLRHGSLHKAKEAGAIRLEGKDYVVRDGDVITFRFGT